MNTLIVFASQYLIILVAIGACLPLIKLTSIKRGAYVLVAILSGVCALILAKLASSLYFDPRPFTRGVHALISHTADNGFPSDHTWLCVTAAGVAFTASRRLGFILLLLALVVGSARVMAGVHSAVDVIGGVAVGLLGVLMGCLMGRTIEKKFRILL
jgi:undecaprenyl-diphosphatase